MRGKSGIVHTLDSLPQFVVEPMEELTNKPVNKPTLAPRHQHPPAPPAISTECPGTSRGTRAFSVIFMRLLLRLLRTAVDWLLRRYTVITRPLNGCYMADTRLLCGRYLALAQSRIASKKRSHSLSCSSSIHSFGECAWAISPGPQMMLCTPARWNWPASVP